MKTRKGFTLIELMIVIAIIAIIAAIAIPNLMASRIRANEATAVSGLKQIATAQVTFQAGKQGRNLTATNGGINGFCSNYRNLAFAPPFGDATANSKLALISDAIANAFVTANDTAGGAITTLGTAGTNGRDDTATNNYQGYKFENDAALAGQWGVNFASYAIPVTGGTTGNNMYWLGQQGTVQVQGVSKGAAAATQAATNSPESAASGWTNL